MITVVTGPPCAGKSTYVAENAQPGDVIVDYDKLATALGSPNPHDAPKAIRQCAFDAREAAIERVLDGVDADAWIIHTQPKADWLADYKAAGAEVVDLDPGLDECLARAAANDRPAWTEQAIRDYYKSAPDIRVKERAMSPAGGTIPDEVAGGAMLTKNVPIGQVKAGPDDGLDEGEFLVYPSTFTRTPDAYGDIVAAGAFAKNIEEWKDSGNVLPGLFGHNMSDPDYFVAYAIDMGEDDHGWWVKGRFDMDSPKAAQVYRLVKGRRLTQLSFAFDVIDQASVDLDDGNKANELRELKVYEFSFVPVGANQDTSVVAVKALADAVSADIKAGRVLSSKNETALRTAHEAIGKVLDSITPQDSEKASTAGPSHSGEASQQPAPVTPQGDDEKLIASYKLATLVREGE